MKLNNSGRKEKKDKVFINHASVLTVGVFQLAFLCFSVLASVKGFGMISALLLALALFGFIANRLARFSANNLKIKINSQNSRLFPGERAVMKIEAYNSGRIPINWIRIEKALAWPYILKPECSESELRNLTSSEKNALGINSNGKGKFLVKNLEGISPKKKKISTIIWKAERRGILHMSDANAITGDPLGLCSLEISSEKTGKREFVVYPKLANVETDYFTKNIWEGEVSRKGTLEDTSVIRLTRPYEDSDSMKHINWRMLARGQELTVNKYEEVSLSRLYFIFDGMSFLNAGKAATGAYVNADVYTEPSASLHMHISTHKPAPSRTYASANTYIDIYTDTQRENKVLEDSLSFMASLVLKLEENDVFSGVALPETGSLGAVNIAPERGNLPEILYRLAEFSEPRKTVVRPAYGDIAAPIEEKYFYSNFHREGMAEQLRLATRSYFISFDKSTADEHRDLIQGLSEITGKRIESIYYSDIKSMMKSKAGQINDRVGGAK